MSEDNIESGGVSPSDEVNIQDVIRDRKEERRLKAEEKRQVDLQRIRDMRSTTGIDPLQRFPKEIWLKILDELDPEDRGNICEVHPLFRDLLKTTRVCDMLPQILKLVKPQIFDYDETMDDYWPGGDEFELLRCISKSTRNSVDRYKEDDLIESIHEYNAGDDFEVILCYGDTREPPMLSRLLTSFGKGVENPGRRFYSRALALSIEDGELNDDINEFKKDVTTLLESIGDQIWHFRFSMEKLSRAHSSFSDVYILFQSWASLMPKLRWLEVIIEHPYQMINVTRDETQFIVAEAALQSHPFPHLSNLERLSFLSSYQHQFGKRGTFLNIYEIILGANQHIKMLDLKDNRNRELILVPGHLTQPLQLTRFTVCDEDWWDRQGISCMRRIEPIVNFNWPLQTIVLGLHSDRKGESLSSVFRFLQMFPTLETVNLNRLEGYCIGDSEKLGYLQLPNLKEFEIELTAPEIHYKSNIHFLFSLQFLVYCGKLQRIFWKLKGLCGSELGEHLKQCEDQMRGNIIDFRGGLRCVYDSNIWQVFPFLDRIHVNIQQDKLIKISSCSHDYLRTEIESMSVRKFWKTHWCSQYCRPKWCIFVYLNLINEID